MRIQIDLQCLGILPDALHCSFHLSKVGFWSRTKTCLSSGPLNLFHLLGISAGVSRPKENRKHPLAYKT